MGYGNVENYRILLQDIVNIISFCSTNQSKEKNEKFSWKQAKSYFSLVNVINKTLMEITILRFF